MSRRQFIVLSLFLALFALLVSPPDRGLNAQEPPPEPISNPVPTEPEQPDMAYQPPADADELSDFLPPEGELLEAPPAQPITPTMPITPVVPLPTQPALPAPPITPTTPITPVVPITSTLPVTAVAEVTFNGILTNLVSFEGGEVAVVLEADTISDTAVLEFTVVPTLTVPLTNTNTFTNPVDSVILQRFQLEVVQDGELLSDQFEKPVRIVVDMRSLTDDLNPVYAGNYFLAYADENEPGLWHEVPITVHQEDGLISAEVMHFSSWVGGARPERWNPSVVPPTVSEFSGAATYSYPIEVPPGRHGLQPAVSLSYSSRGLDGATSDMEAGDVANGWSLAQIAIMRRGVKVEPWGGPLYIYHPDDFSLVLNGTSHFLEHVGDPIANGTIRYYAKDAPGLKIWRYYDPLLNDTDGLYWVVTTPEGTQYRLGYTDDSEETQQGTLWYATAQTHWGDANNISAIAWNVDTVTDTFGNQMQYSYYTRSETETLTKVGDSGTTYQLTITTRTSRLKDITYNYPTRATLPVTNTVGRLGGTPGSAVKFRAVGDNDSTGQFTNPISSVYIFHNNTTTPIKEIRITSQNDQVTSPGCERPVGSPRITNTRVVTSIRLHTGTDADVNTSTNGNMLPAVTFEYSSKPHFLKNGLNCFSFRYLYRVHSGYGGMTTFAYTSDNRSEGSYDYYSGTDSTNWPRIGYNYFVHQVASNDGRGNTTTTEYAYSTPCYGQWNTSNVGTLPGAFACYQSQDPEFGNITGFASTTVTHKGYSGEILNQQITTFSQNAATTLGQPTEIQVKDAAGTLLSKTTHAYATESIAGLPNMFTYVNDTRNYQYNGGNTLSSKTTYEYNTVNQGGTQYGNLTHIREFDDVADVTPYRTTQRWYYPKTTGDYWLVGLLGAESLYSGNPSTTTQINGVWNYYDNDTDPATPPTQGKLIRSRTFIPLPNCTAVPGGGGSGCVYARQTIDTTYGYDAGGFGNQTSITTYSDYGYRTFKSDWEQAHNAYPTGSITGPQTTTITYESGYNLYPISVSNPALQVTDFQIYGFNGVAVDGFQKQSGLLKQVTGPDDVTTKYEYDPFGRLHAIYDANTTYQSDDFAGFGDTLPWNGDPVEQYRYWDNTWNDPNTFLNPAGNAPYLTSVLKRPGSFPAPANSSSGFAFADQTFYDGFGRPIQTRSIWNWVEGQAVSREIIRSTAYGANGQVSCQTAPYDVAFYSDSPRNLVWPASPFVTDTCLSKPHTTTTYDALSRPTAATAPDGSVTTYLYDILSNVNVGGVDGYNLLARTRIVDANNHVTGQFSNSLGQLVLVREYSGVHPSPTASADTRYTYDVAGNLTDVKTSDWLNSQPSSFLSQTSMTYDGYGRKTSMTDPDMGTWTYAYYATGNLTLQLDANGDRQCFYYDVLDRLQSKWDDAANNSCANGAVQLAGYTYHTTGTGKVGKLSEIRWGNSSTQNLETFNYDPLGRLTTHTRDINDRVYTMTYSGFDALHRPASRILTWPNGNTDTVSATYDHEGENTLSGGGSSLVEAIGYNDMGQLKRVALGNGLTTWYGYGGYESSANNDAYDAKEVSWYWGASEDFGHLWRICTAPDTNTRCLADNQGLTASGQLLDVRHSYDDVGNVAAIRDYLNDNQVQTFGYDHLNRLETAYTSDATGNSVGQYVNNNETNDYDYDKLGNIMSFGGNSQTYNTGHKHAVDTAQGVTFSYDANGNMTLRNASGTANDYAQVFNVENELTSVTNNGSVTSFAYDAAGIRTKTVAPSGVTTYYPFPGYEEEVNGSTTTRRITYSAAGQAIALRVQIVSGSNTLYYLHSDHLGSTSLATTTGGSVVNGSTSRYYPFGGWRTEPIANLTDRGFTGHLHNNLGSGADDIGLIYMNARWYLPGVGRFISADTLVPDLTNPQGWNRYSYALNNPLKYVDPSGHCWGFASGLRNTFYGTTCNNLDMAVTIVTSPDASVGEKILASGYIATEAVAHATLVVGASIIAGETVAAAAPYASSAIVTAESAAIAHPTAAAVAGGIAETSVECSMSGGGCGVWDYVAGAVTAGVAHRLSTPGGGCSFSEETLITTEGGLVPIGEIEEGEFVLAYNEVIGEMDYYPVTTIWAHKDSIIVLLTIDGELIETTPEHPFFTDDGEWVQAGHLKSGDEIRDAAWGTGTVEAITFTVSSQTMYNFAVATAHTYFVGDKQWLVHNQCSPNEVGPANQLRANSRGDGLDIHHVPQSHPASQVVPGYSPITAPAIALPEAVHGTIPRMSGPYAGSPRDLLANDLWNLRGVGVPNNSLSQLIDLNRTTYPGVFD